jgi:biotin-(acetyl-CoA carboxylase) ligase
MRRSLPVRAHLTCHPYAVGDQPLIHRRHRSAVRHLLRLRFSPTRPDRLGIGINVNHTVFPAELDAIATSLRRELPNLGAPGLASETWVHECLRREPLAAAILIALDAELRALTSNLAPRPSNLSQYSSWISGKRVRVETCDDGSSGYTGVTAGLDPQGFLCVHGDDGQLHTVLSGGLREP